MDRLPNELLVLIFKCCSAGDLKELACCNTFFRDKTRAVLWECVCIPVNNNEELEGKPIENLRYTRKLTFKSDIIRIKFPDCNDIIKKVVSFCARSLLDELVFDDVLTEEGISHALSQFDRLLNLDFKCCYFKKAKSIAKVPAIRELKLDSTDFDNQWHDNGGIRETTGLQRILHGQTDLEVIKVENGYFVKSDAIEVLSRVVSLKKLELCCTERFYQEEDPANTINFGPLSNLVNLTYLELTFCYVPNLCLQTICRHLVKLEELKLFESTFHARGIRRDCRRRNIHVHTRLPLRMYTLTTVQVVKITTILLSKLQMILRLFSEMEGTISRDSHSAVNRHRNT